MTLDDTPTASRDEIHKFEQGRVAPLRDERLATRATGADEAPIAAPIQEQVAQADQAPVLVTTAPAPQKVLAKAEWSVSYIDLYEINEALAAVATSAARELDIPNEKLKARRSPRGVRGLRIGGRKTEPMAIEV